MRNLFCIIAAIFLLPLITFSQHIEVGVMAGGSTYMGDLSPNKAALSTGTKHLAGGIFARYNKNDYIALKLGFNYGTVGADDALSSSAGRQSRNLNFKSSIFEASLTGEFNIFGYDSKFLTRTFSPYVFAGVGFFKFNPKGELDGTYYELQPLGTEGQGLPELPYRQPYKLSGVSIPFGMGVKWALNDKINIGAELGMRKTFTDYLDDVSQLYAGDDLLVENGKDLTAAFSNRSDRARTSDSRRGNPEYNDWYIFGGLNVSINLLDTGLSGPRRKNRKGIGCPTF